VINLKVRNPFARIQGPARETEGRRLVFRKPRVSLAKPLREGVRGFLSHLIHDRWLGLDLMGGRADMSTSQVCSGWVEALTRGAHRSAICRGRGACWPLDRRSMALVPQTARTIIHESGTSDQYWPIRIGREGFSLLQSARGGALRGHTSTVVGGKADLSF
jgi:hypothetical protein